MPRSAVLAAQPLAVQRECPLTGGDDYELLFTALPDRCDADRGAGRGQRRLSASRASAASRAVGRFTSSTGKATRSPPAACPSITSGREPGSTAPMSTNEPAVNPPLAGQGRALRVAPPGAPGPYRALGFGSGLSPVAPGTVGTLWAWFVYALAASPGRCALGGRARSWARSSAGGPAPSPRVTSRSPTRAPGLDEVGRASGPCCGSSCRRGCGRRSQIGLGAVSAVRCRQAGAGGLGRRTVQGSARPADRLGTGLRHHLRRLIAALVHAGRHRAAWMAVSRVRADRCHTLAGAVARVAKIATAESCTGGCDPAACTSVAGSSDWFERGFVTYSNQAKTQMLALQPC